MKPFVRLLLPLVCASLLGADSGVPQNNEIVDRYLYAWQAQLPLQRGLEMRVEIDAELPKLKKKGKLQAFRNISRIGQITYRALEFVGDNTIKKNVIARYLAAETQASEGSLSMGVTPNNYRFKYKGMNQRDGRLVHVLELKPTRKQVGLFKGELWLDPDTYLPVRESGTFVKNPSIFLKKVQFVRYYEIRDGMSLPRRVDSIVDTRIVGKAQLHIEFSHFTRLETEQVAAFTGDDVQ